MSPSNITFDRTAGSRSLAAAGQRERSAYEVIVDGSLTHERGIS
jgi:hypothetical protein